MLIKAIFQSICRPYLIFTVRMDCKELRQVALKEWHGQWQTKNIIINRSTIDLYIIGSKLSSMCNSNTNYTFAVHFQWSLQRNGAWAVPFCLISTWAHSEGVHVMQCDVWCVTVNSRPSLANSVVRPLKYWTWVKGVFYTCGRPLTVGVANTQVRDERRNREKQKTNETHKQTQEQAMRVYWEQVQDTTREKVQ